jgi:penicillin-binding protein 1B
MKPKRGLFRLIRNTLLILVALTLAAGIAGIVIYGGYLAKQIDNRFANRRWNIPSKVYSDSTLLYQGQAVNRELLLGKLSRLGYRQVEYAPGYSGEMRSGTSSLELFLHDFQSPILDRIGFPVRIKLAGNRISEMVRPDTEKILPLLELEPEELMLFFGPDRERRQLVSIQQVPLYLIHAILAAEDRGFYSHPGVDFKGILRALITNLREGAIRQGGSTLTQQLAKNYFLTPERTYKRKLNELLIALILEFKYEKDEILEIYLNEIYWGQKGSVSINGVGAAARFYFDKRVSELSVAESAALAGLIKAPNAYSPYVNKVRCQNRRNDVLQAMKANDWISQEELQSILPRPVVSAGFTKYNRRAPYFVDYLSHQLATLYPPEVLSSLGLSIYTTLDTQVQEAAEQALSAGLSRLENENPGLKQEAAEKQLQGVVIVMQPKTGYILAMVGGREYGTSQFNRATQAKRQPGSAFKPLVYLSGLEEFTPATRLNNMPRVYTTDSGTWQPKNFDKSAEPELSLRRALATSQNVATVNLAMQIGLQRIVDTAAQFQFSTPAKPYPSLALGAFEVIPLELARAYCVFAADGVQPFPLSLKEVVDENGEMLERHHANIRRLIPPEKAFIMNEMLRSVVLEGTARSLKRRGVDWPVAGKTGTSNDSRDAWFVGYTPDILALVWVGFDNGDSIDSSGSRAALPIWAELMKAIPQHVSGEWFRAPSEVARRTICADSGQLAVAGSCPRQVEEVFLQNHAPTENCPLHGPVSPLEKFWKGVLKIVPSS